MNKLRLSYSSINTFKACGYKYYLDKVEKIRPTWINSSLMFGSAIDEAMESILKGNTDEVDVLTKSMNSFEVFGRQTDIMNVRYSVRDLQIELLDEGFVERYEELAAIRKNKKPFTEEEQLDYNNMAHNCLIEKGTMLLEELRTWYEDYVDEVVEIQKKVELENEYGDKFVGYLDFIVKNKKGEKVLIDLKTSSDANKYYPEGCVEDSDQLAIYTEECDTDKAAYLVVDKGIRKREPRVRIKFVEGLITEDKLDGVFNDIEEQTSLIKSNEFNQNKDSCFQFGRCQYFDYCHKNKSMKGLAYDKKKV